MQFLPTYKMMDNNIHHCGWITAPSANSLDGWITLLKTQFIVHALRKYKYINMSRTVLATVLLPHLYYKQAKPWARLSLWVRWYQAAKWKNKSKLFNSCSISNNFASKVTCIKYELGC